jgi:hypothetical protein
VGAGAAVVFVASQWYGTSPLGTDALLATQAAAVAVVWWLSGRSGWGPRHAAALAVGALTAAGVLAFASDPLGDVSATRQLVHNLTLLLVVLVTGLLGVRRAGRSVAA